LLVKKCLNGRGFGVVFEGALQHVRKKNAISLKLRKNRFHRFPSPGNSNGVKHPTRFPGKIASLGVEEFCVVSRCDGPKKQRADVHGPVSGCPLKALQAPGNMFRRSRLPATVATQEARVAH
jgi:hypothetical protein